METMAYPPVEAAPHGFVRCLRGTEPLSVIAIVSTRIVEILARCSFCSVVKYSLDAQAGCPTQKPTTRAYRKGNMSRIISSPPTQTERTDEDAQ